MTHLSRVVIVVGLLALSAVGVVACGGNGGDGDEQRGTAKGTAEERAFLQAMIPHHESAVEMAKVAKRRGGHGQITKLGREIVSTQSQEISQMGRIHRRLFGAEIKPDPGAHDVLGLSAEEAGAMHMEAASKLERAKPFDRAFIDEMVPHHQGAIRMARAVLRTSRDREVESLARGIIDAQSMEIDDMNGWRRRWYGSASPAGGIPKDEPGKPVEEHEGGHSG